MADKGFSVENQAGLEKSTIKLVEEEDNGDENKERGNWSSQLDFILSCLGYAVGLGNVWRFPYLAYRNGGGAFLIPYVIMLALAGLPIFFLEVSFGQYSSRGPIACWSAVPMFRGVGYGMMILSAYVGIYYNVIIAYTLYYMFASFTSELPWVGCYHNYNTPYCSEIFEDCLKEVVNETRKIIDNNNNCTKITNLDIDLYNITIDDDGEYNLTNYKDPFKDLRARASEEYWTRNVLHKSDSIADSGTVIWQLALCLLLAWIIVFLCLIKGVKSSGKVVYFTATFPYVVLLILLIHGVTLPGYYEGILFFIVPDWPTLSNPKVWLDAAIQIFFSLSASWGGLITLASYNRFHTNCYRDSLIVAISNCATSVFAGFVIFSIMGFMAHSLDKDVEDVVEGGFGLAFIAYPEAVAQMPASPFWSFLFFFMLLTLGLDSQFTIMETVCTATVDQFPKKLLKKKPLVMFCMCATGFVLGLSCVSEGGSYWIDLLDNYGAGFPLLLFGLFECISMGWIYGIKRFMNDIATMIGPDYIDFPLFFWWPLNWCAITPGLLTFILMFNFINWEEPAEESLGDVKWAGALGWLIITSAIIWIPIVWIYELWTAEGTMAERWRTLVTPREDWGPALQKFRKEAWQMHKKRGTTMGGKYDTEKKIYPKKISVLYEPSKDISSFNPQEQPPL